MLPSFCNDDVVRIRAAQVNQRGTIVLDWSDVQQVTISGCSVQPSSTSRDFDGRTTQVTDRWDLYAPPGSDLRAGDRIVWNGIAFEIDGAPMPWKSPTGSVSHVLAHLVEWSG